MEDIRFQRAIVGMIFKTNVFILFTVVVFTTCSGRTIVDLTHKLDEKSPKFPLNEEQFPNFIYYNGRILQEGFVNWGTPNMWVSIGKVEFYEHYGTHMDAPIHFGYGQDRMADIPPWKLIGPGIVIDVKEKAKLNPNYAVTVDDIINFEDIFGEIPSNAIVLMNSGWYNFFLDHKKYLGTENLKDVTSWNFPGFSLEACQFLYNERSVAIIGVDTMSVDPGNSWSSEAYGKPYPCHHFLQPNNVPLLENLANLDAVPPTGTTMFLGGLKTATGTASPARVLAIIEEQQLNERDNMTEEDTEDDNNDQN